MSVAVSSCDYLDIVPEMKVPEEQVDFTNTSEMYQAVSGVYAIVRTAGCHWPVNLVTVIRDGDVWSGRYDDQAEMVTVGCNYVYNNSHWAFNDIWVNHYTIIRIATEALKSLDEYAKYITNEADMKKYLSYCAEVRTIRAWAYYRLVQTFGDVTILRDPDQTDLQRSDKRLVYQYMLEGDLDYAWKYGEKLRPNEMEHIGAYTAYTARMIAAKVYLELGDYAKVEECTNDIITSRKFSLYPDFYQLFKIPGKLCDEKLMEVQKVLEAAAEAKAIGSTRFCMGAAWKHPSAKDMPYVLEMVKGVKKLGLETCMTLGRLTQEQTQALADAGLDYYNHNLDTSPEFYGNIITTRTYSERLQTLAYVREAGMKICSGGILGMGESVDDRAGLLIQLANLPEHPESVPINMLVKVKGTPLAEEKDVDPFDFIRTLAVARIMMPKSHVRLSAGREQMNEQMQALAFMAGANSIFYGEKLLTTKNPQAEKDMQLFARLGIKPEEREEHADEVHQAAIEQALVEQRESKLFYNAASA